MKRINVILCAAIVASSGVYAYVLTVEAQTPTPPYVFHCCRNGVCTTYYGTTGCEDGDTHVDGPCTPNPCVITGGEQDGPPERHVFCCCRNGGCSMYIGTLGCEDGDTKVDCPCVQPERDPPNPCVPENPPGAGSGDDWNPWLLDDADLWDEPDIVDIVADLFPPMEADVSGDRCHNEDPSLISILPPSLRAMLDHGFGPGEPEPHTVWVTYESTTWAHAGVQVRLDTDCMVDWLSPDFEQRGDDPRLFIWTFEDRMWHAPSSHLVARLDCDVTELGVHPYVQIDRDCLPNRGTCTIQPPRIAACTPYGCPEPDMPVKCEDEGGSELCDPYSEECY